MAPINNPAMMQLSPAVLSTLQADMSNNWTAAVTEGGLFSVPDTHLTAGIELSGTGPYLAFTLAMHSGEPGTAFFIKCAPVIAALTLQNTDISPVDLSAPSGNLILYRGAASWRLVNIS